MLTNDVQTAVDVISYDDLYARAEQGQWRATDIDFSEDRRHWHEEMDDRQRRAALWNYNLFFHGEHEVAATLGPFIDAAPRPEHKYFLASQQYDEARHAVFFARFMDEVVGEGRDVEVALRATHRYTTWGWRKTFARLDELSAELRGDPSLPRLAAAVMLYHIVIEAGLAQPGQRFLEQNLEETGLLPGLYEGMRRVSLDEQRHIAFGVKFLADVRDEPGCLDAMADIARETLPWASSVLVPPNWDEEGYVGVLGYSLEDIVTLGIDSFDSKLRAAGLRPEDLHGAVPWRADLPPAERARRLVALMRANYVGEKNGSASRDPEDVALLFEAMALTVDHRHAPPRPVTFAWDFDDFDMWHLTVANGRTRAAAGRPDATDLVLRCEFDDWIDIAAGRLDPRRALVTRRLRPRGDLRLLPRFARMFGA